MKSKSYLGLLVLSLLVIICTSWSAKTKASAHADTCEQTVKYYISKIVGSGKEMEVKMEIIISPSNKNINLKAAVQNEGKMEFDTTIESFECSLDPKLTKGEAIYKGNIKQENGSLTKSILKVGTDENGKLYLSNGNPEKNEKMIMLVDKWEVLKD